MYCGASVMWVVDGIASLLEGEPFVELTDSVAMADDALLGACVVALGLAAWIIVLIVKRAVSTRVARA